MAGVYADVIPSVRNPQLAKALPTVPKDILVLPQMVVLAVTTPPRFVFLNVEVGTRTANYQMAMA